MKKLKLGVGIVLVVAMLAAGLAGCGKDAGAAGDKAQSGTINPISREEGSGTRGAFVELFGIEEKDDQGNKVDKTDTSIEVTNSTAAVIQSVIGNENSIGYISLGSLNDEVKAVKIDGTEPTAENIQKGDYKIARPFNIVTNDKESGAAKDFIAFIMSKDGQQIVEKNAYIPVKEAKDKEYKSTNPSGKVSIAGSSSVTPLMQKLAEAYKKVNSNVEVQVQQSDSTTGVNALIDGACDIGMASRELKDSEISKGAKPIVIAQDGIAIIVNKANKIDNLTKDQVKEIYLKKITDWKDIK